MPNAVEPTHNGTEEHRHAAVPMLIGPVFLVMAAWFLWGSTPDSIPHTEPIRVTFDQVTTDPLRIIPDGPPTIVSGGYDLKCMECHRLFESSSQTSHLLNQHLDIQLNHGLNDRCLNCHDEVDRDRLWLPGGKTVSFSESTLLCARCHGPTFRDWQRGMHGRTNGYWDTTRGEQVHLRCTECHNPHAPAVNPMTLLPGPHTLRVDGASESKHDSPPSKHNPLRRWSSNHSQSGLTQDEETTVENR